jgi:acetyl-CoA carboxylase carboxyl transferase subunit beta
VSWLKKLMPARIRTEAPAGRKRSVPEGLWEKCDRCGAVLYRPELEENLEVCPKCNHHMPIRARVRLNAFLDAGSTSEIGATLGPVDVLKFKDQKKYSDRIRAAQKATGERDALIALQGTLKGQPLVACAFDFAFMGGSMGSVVGAKIARLGQRSLERKYPLVLISASGGARMQEGVLSLMQMAKTSALLAQLAERRIPYVSVLTNPTTGGVSASFAMLGDAIVAEPGAVIGFAGPRVIKQTIGQDLPEGFQTAEFLLDHGMLDVVSHRRDLKSSVGGLLRHMSGQPAATSWVTS